jgi:hypothetical protein
MAYPPFPCIESTVEFTAGRYEVRAWINEGELKDDYDNSSFKADAIFRARLPLGQFAEQIARLQGVNAVHVKDRATGDGIVIYVNWP